MEDPPNRDSNERVLALEALRASEERYRLLFDRSPLPMWVYDQETLGFLAVNQAAIDHYGYTRDEFGAMTIAQVSGGEVLEAEDELEAGAEEKAQPSILRHRKASGDTIDVEITSHALNFAGRAARLVIANDVTERVRAEQRLWRAAFYDALTGLPNRALFMERLGQAEARDGIAGAADPIQPARDGDQELVPGAVSHRVVHQLETVQIEKQHREPAAQPSPRPRLGLA